MSAARRAALSFAVSRRAARVSGGSYRNAAVNEAIGRLTAVSFDSLPNEAGCTTFTASQNPFPHTRCVTVASPTSKHRQVTLVITPASSLYRVDTIVFDRTRPSPGNPFNQ